MERPRSAIQREIRQQRPFRSRAQECLIGLFRTADALKCRISTILGATGITLQQYNVLRILRGSPEGLPTLEIAERMVEHAPGITRLMARLEKKGLVRRKRTEEDRREVRCWITAAGNSILADLEEELHRRNDECFKVLGRHELTDLIRLMDKIRSGLVSLGSPSSSKTHVSPSHTP
jgi:DNA-binding MarR family transcriptional regulator